MGIPVGSHGRRGLYSLGNVRQVQNNSDGLGSFFETKTQKYLSFSLENPSLDYLLPGKGSFSLPSLLAIHIFQRDSQVIFGIGSILGTGGHCTAGGHGRNLHLPPAWHSHHFSSHCHPCPSSCYSLRICLSLHRPRMGFSVFQLFGKLREVVPHLLFALQMFLTGIPRLS